MSLGRWPSAPSARAPPSAPLGCQLRLRLPPLHPPFEGIAFFFFLCGGGNDSVVLRWCHGAASGLRGENSLSFARETQTRERRGLRAVPCGARGLADPGCCAAAAAAAAAAKAGGGLEWWWRRRQRQRPGSSSGSPSQLAAEAGERPALPGAQRRWLAPGNNMGKTCPLAAARGEGGVECRHPRRARPRLRLLFRCRRVRRWPRTPGIGGKGGMLGEGETGRRDPRGSRRQ